MNFITLLLLSSMKHVACGIMCNEQNQILLGKRHSKGPYPNIWEFPGGKLEEGETLEECLQREWIEELNLSIVVDCKVITYVSGTDKRITCHFFIGRILDLPNLKMNIHESVDFFYPNQMKSLKMFKEDDKIVNVLCSMFSM